MVMNAEEGAFQETTDGNYTLTLTGVDAEMLAFTDRPVREAQTWDTTGFLDDWTNGFGDDPPNAVISADSETAITIYNPQAVGDTVTFTATPLPGQDIPTGVINQPTLFIAKLLCKDWKIKKRCQRKHS